MSNYINVLRRLERERRTPETAAPATAPAQFRSPEEPPFVVPVAEVRIAPAAKPMTPELIVPPVAPPPSTVVERTVLELPNVVAASPTTAPSMPPAPPSISAAAAASAVRSTAVVAEPSPAGHVPDTRRARAFAGTPDSGIATLLDSIRLISNGRERRVVVFCGASNAEAVTALAEALVAHAERTGMRALLATLTRTGTGSAVVPAHIAGSALPVDLDAGTSIDALAAWADQLDHANDLVVVTGPPLASSIDAALLACASDGLVIVAESEVTERAALQVAAERARIAGCKTLGVVMHGTKERLPKWLSRLMGGRSESHVS